MLTKGGTLMLLNLIAESAQFSNRKTINNYVERKKSSTKRV
jgi:hypothetical protein